MSYEKQTWVTGETVTADKLNHMEDGIADAGGASGTYMFSIWHIDSSGNMATDGDYATARALLADARPIIAVICAWNLDQDYPKFADYQILSVELDQTNIKLWLSSTYGYSWTENGLEYFEL